MDKRVRPNDICIIGQPRCGYAFSSSRSCFIGYAFEKANLEVEILSRILEERGIEPVQAGDRLAAGQNVFCTKICSKIITSQFCAVIANNDETLNGEVPNANVHLEYGMMLAFNKHIIPFQLDHQKLAFNVAGLDTVKYNQRNFKDQAVAAVDAAIANTTPGGTQPAYDQILETFFIANEVLLSPVDNEGEQVLLNRARGLGYLLLNDFTGWNYIYFGIFPHLTPQAIRWRLEKTRDILNGITTSVELRVKAGFATEEQQRIAKEAISRFSIWLVVSDRAVRDEILMWHASSSFPFPVRIFLDSEVREQFERIATGEEFEGALTANVKG